MSLSDRLRLFRTRLQRVRASTAQLDIMQAALGRIEARQCAALSSDDPAANEFRTWSQFGEDGIIQWLVRRTPPGPRTFVEFGVQHYVESNTRYLLVNDDWTGAVIDGSTENIGYIRSDPIYGRYALRAVCAFIDRDNINALIAGAGLSGDIGLLSVDIDGNDYWVWRAIDVVRPRIVVCEYNNLFGSARAVSVPYDRAFSRDAAHHSLLYFGASLAALEHLGREKGYRLVACTSAGNNAFFVREDVAGTLQARTAAELWRPAGFREARRPDGSYSFAERPEQRALVAQLPLVDVVTGETLTVGALPSEG